jgi:hypothetical protein
MEVKKKGTKQVRLCLICGGLGGSILSLMPAKATIIIHLFAIGQNALSPFPDLCTRHHDIALESYADFDAGRTMFLKT